MKQKPLFITSIFPTVVIILALSGLLTSGFGIWAELETLRQVEVGQLAAKDLVVSVVLLSPHPIHYVWPSLLLLLPFIYWRFIRGTTFLEKTWSFVPLFAIILVAGYLHLQLNDYLSDIRTVRQLREGAGSFLKYVHTDLNGELPNTTDSYNSKASKHISLRHPITGRPFSYSRMSNNQFMLCALLRTDGHVHFGGSREQCFVFEMRRQPNAWNSFLEIVEGREILERF